MGRLGGITETLSQLLEQAGVALPAWAFPAVIVLLFLTALPAIRRNSRVHRARLLVAEIASEQSVDRAARKAQAIALVADHPVGLVGLADEAIRRGVRDLATLALNQLRAHGRPVQEILRLETELHGPPPAHLQGELAAVEQLITSGAHGAAMHRLQRAQRAWPSAPELRSLASRLAEE
jgi:hypothetical protein